jgi:perosamine synthetase
MTSGEGGMLVTDNEDLADAARLMRDHGLTPERIMVKFGHNWCMSEITAIVGIHQLARLDSFIRRRNEIAQGYASYLEGVEGISLFKKPPNIRHSYYKYPLRLADDINVKRVAMSLKDIYGIETGQIYYPPCHLHPYYKETFGTGEGDFPTAEKVLGKVLCLPVHLAITDRDIEYIADALVRTLAELRNA